MLRDGEILAVVRTADGDLDSRARRRSSRPPTEPAARTTSPSSCSASPTATPWSGPHPAARDDDPDTTETATDRRSVAEQRPRRARHGAGHGSRWVALGAVLVAVAIAPGSAVPRDLAMSARNRELFNLAFGALIAAAAFASVSIALSDEVLRRVADRGRRLRAALPRRAPRRRAASPRPRTRRCCRSPASSARSV